MTKVIMQCKSIAIPLIPKRNYFVRVLQILAQHKSLSLTFFIKYSP